MQNNEKLLFFDILERRLPNLQFIWWEKAEVVNFTQKAIAAPSIVQIEKQPSQEYIGNFIKKKIAFSFEAGLGLKSKP